MACCVTTEKQNSACKLVIDLCPRRQTACDSVLLLPAKYMHCLQACLACCHPHPIFLANNVSWDIQNPIYSADLASLLLIANRTSWCVFTQVFWLPRHTKCIATVDSLTILFLPPLGLKVYL